MGKEKFASIREIRGWFSHLLPMGGLSRSGRAIKSKEFPLKKASAGENRRRHSPKEETVRSMLEVSVFCLHPYNNKLRISLASSNVTDS
jgi:hypothetical protein